MFRVPNKRWRRELDSDPTQADLHGRYCTFELFAIHRISEARERHQFSRKLTLGC